MTAILQHSLPYDPFAPRPLPGIQPLAPQDWLIFDEACAGQMAERDRLLDNHRDAVLAIDPAAEPAAQELLDMVLAAAYPTAGSTAQRPDGVTVTIDRADPMDTLGRLVQEDLCILQKRGDEHVLTAAVLCFPASWRLDEKFLRPLTDIHMPVEEYDGNLARRVQRLFDGVRPGRPLWRINALWYADPALHQPRSIHDRREERAATSADYLRSEKQSILRLPRTDAVVFSIHTFVLPRSAVRGSPVVENSHRAGAG